MGQAKFRKLLILAGLFLIPLSVRFFYLLELSQNPFFDTVLKSFDHYNFDLGAQNFAQGDWLAQSPNNTYSPLYKYFLGVIYYIFGRNFLCDLRGSICFRCLGLGAYLFDRQKTV